MHVKSWGQRASEHVASGRPQGGTGARTPGRRREKRAGPGAGPAEQSAACGPSMAPLCPEDAFPATRRKGLVPEELRRQDSPPGPRWVSRTAD